MTTARHRSPREFGATARAVAALILACLPCLPAHAAEDGRWHRIELIGGFAEGAAGEVVVAQTTVRASGGVAPLGGLGYLRGDAGSLAYTLGLKALSLEAEVDVSPGVVSTWASEATTIQLGARYYLSRPADGPYLAAAIGPVIGRESSTRVGDSVEVASRSHTVMGGELAVGLDFPLAGAFGLAAEVAYLLAGDFDEPVGGRSSATGAQFGLRLSWTFGR